MILLISNFVQYLSFLIFFIFSLGNLIAKEKINGKCNENPMNRKIELILFLDLFLLQGLIDNRKHKESYHCGGEEATHHNCCQGPLDFCT